MKNTYTVNEFIKKFNTSAVIKLEYKNNKKNINILLTRETLDGYNTNTSLNFDNEFIIIDLLDTFQISQERGILFLNSLLEKSKYNKEQSAHWNNWLEEDNYKIKIVPYLTK